MKKNVLALSITAALIGFGFASYANAAVPGLNVSPPLIVTAQTDQSTADSAQAYNTNTASDFQNVANTTFNYSGVPAARLPDGNGAPPTTGVVEVTGAAIST